MPAAAAAATQAVERARRFGEQLTRWAPVPGGAVCVVDRHGTLATATFGQADLERALPMGQEHLFQIGSISKVVTSLVLARLADDGLVDLGEPIVRTLPWVDLGPGGQSVTLRDLLSHTAGLIAGSDAPPDDLAQAWALRRAGRVAQTVGHFHYSNVGFVLAGLAAQACGRAPLADLVRDLVLEPAGMTGSVPAITHADRSRFAVGYTPARQDRPWVPGDPLAPMSWFESGTGDGNVGATTADLARLARLLLGGGQIDGRRVVSAARFGDLAAPHAPTGEPVFAVPGRPVVELSRYGLGINVERIEGNTCLTHGGGMVGYSTFLLADQDADLGVVVLLNANGDSLYAQWLARAVHGEWLDRSAGRPATTWPSADPRARQDDGWQPALTDSALGRFLADDAPSTRPARGGSSGSTTDEPSATPVDAVEVCRRADGHLEVVVEGHRAVLFRTPTGRFVTDHPRLRRFHLDLLVRDGEVGWVHGPQLLLPAPAPAARPPIPEPPDPAVGHYRCQSPWFPDLRIVQRSGDLWLCAPGGVEAPSEDEQLVPLEPGRYRIGADPRAPERLVVGPLVQGQAVWVERDGLVYSRTFTA